MCNCSYCTFIFIMCLHLSALYLSFWTWRFIRTHQGTSHRWPGRYHLAVAVLFQFSSLWSAGNYMGWQGKVLDVRSRYNSPVNTFVSHWPCQFWIIISPFQNCQNTLGMGARLMFVKEGRNWLEPGEICLYSSGDGPVEHISSNRQKLAGNFENANS